MKAGFRARDVKFDDIRLFLCDPRAQVRSSLRMALNEAGLKNANIDEGADMDAVANAVSDPNGPDIIICDVTDCSDQACQLFASIRHNEHGTNPFICIIAVAWSPRQPLVAKVVDSGADILVAAPISPGLILNRISSLVHSRKPFVVTTDYVGPDRRSMDEASASPRPGSEIELVDVPNSLREKALGQFDAARIRREIDATRDILNIQKIERQAFQVGYLVTLISTEFEKSPRDVTPRHLVDLDKVSNDLKLRAFSAGARELEELCVPLRQVIRTMIDTRGKYRQRDVDLLNQLALAVKAAVKPDRVSADLAHDISRTVTGAA